MKFQKLLAILIACSIICIPKINSAQTINLGTAANFVFFTSSGAVDNVGTSVYTGNLGTNVGAFTGFGSEATVNGNKYAANSITAQASTDLIAAYNQLKNIPPTNTSHANAFGSETLFQGVYSVAGAGSVGGNLILDGGGHADAVFIFKIGGAFTTGAASVISLVNGASACNIYWVAEGAISMAASTEMKGTLIANNAANSMGANCTLDGRLFSTTGALSANTSTAKLPVCSGWIGGISADWNTAGNWVSSIIPTSTTNTTIPANPLYSPVISGTGTGIGSVNNIIVQSGALLKVSGGKLQISGVLTNAGSFDASGGTIELNGTLAQTINRNTFVNNNIQNLIISNNVNLNGQQNLTGTLSFGNSNVKLTTGDSLILKSTSGGTARVADITTANGNLLTGNEISGLITVERYITAKRAWRLLSVPISSVGAPTINAAWQEGQGGNSISNLNPGFGVHITGGSQAVGYDEGVNNNAAIKVFDTAQNLLVRLPAATGTNIPLTSYPGYFLFIRGDRSTNLLQGTSAAITTATLRMRGHIFTGDTIVSVNNTNTTLVGNPYPSAIDFHAIIKNNVNDKVYLWDPKMNGASGVGGYVTLLWNESTGAYDKTSSASAGVSQYIQSGEAFFVESTGNNATLTIKEKHKSAGGSDFVFKPMTDNKNLSLRVNLFTINSAGSASLSDGVLTTYNDDNLNEVDRNDAKKLYNIAENISIGREAKNLAIERRKTIVGNDTTFLNLYNLKKEAYTLQLSAEGMDSIGLHAVIEDKYLGPSKDTALNIGGITNINFTVNADSASFAANRFSIVFKQDLRLLTVLFSSVKAQQSLKNIVVEWTIEKEFKILKYTVESSSDNINFKKEDTLYANANNNTQQSYFWLDKYVASGMHYYRIGATDIFGKEIFSPVVNVNIDQKVTVSGIAVNGKSMIGKTLTVQFNKIEKGTYNLQLFTMEGVLLNNTKVEHSDASILTHQLTLNNYMPSGKYFLQLAGKSNKYTTYFIIN